MSGPTWEPADWFWDLIESSHRQLPALRAKLAALPGDRLREFQIEYKTAMAVVYYPYRLARGGPEAEELILLSGGDYASWVVSQGRAFFAEVRARPGDLE